MKIGSFDTNSQALKNRVNLQKNLGEFNLNNWIFENLDIAENLSYLDLGCGLGNQTLELLEKGFKNINITAVDASEDSIKLLAESIAKLKCDKKVNTHIGRFDELGQVIQKKQFDRIFGSYSLYYVDDAEKLFSIIHSALKKDGVLFFCGPSHDNNLELKKLLSNISNDNKQITNTIASNFMEEEAPAICKEVFKKEVEILKFKNKVEFYNPQDLFNYWSSHNLYDASLEKEFRKYTTKLFNNGSTFINYKSGIGIRINK